MGLGAGVEAVSKRLKRHAMHYVDPVCVECGGMGVMTSGERAYPHRRDNWGKIYFQCPCGAIDMVAEAV